MRILGSGLSMRIHSTALPSELRALKKTRQGFQGCFGSFTNWRWSYRLVEAFPHSPADPEQAPVGDQGPGSAAIRAGHAVRNYESIFSFPSRAA